MKENKNVGRKPIPQKLLEERRAKAVELKLSGLSTETVKNQLNNLADSRGWGNVTIRTVERDISSYYRENKPSSFEDFENFFAQREIVVAQLEQGIEQIADFIREKNASESWAKGEKIDALKTMFGILKDYADFQGWNLSKRDAGKLFTFTEAYRKHRELSKWDDASEEISRFSEEEIASLGDALERLWHEEMGKKLDSESNEEQES